MVDGRKRGVIFDVGHGRLSLPLEEVILRSTWNPAKVIQHEELGHLSVGAPADIAVLRLEETAGRLRSAGRSAVGHLCPQGAGAQAPVAASEGPNGVRRAIGRGCAG
jgi:predicted amidohydrolase